MPASIGFTGTTAIAAPQYGQTVTKSATLLLQFEHGLTSVPPVFSVFAEPLAVRPNVLIRRFADDSAFVQIEVALSAGTRLHRLSYQRKHGRLLFPAGARRITTRVAVARRLVTNHSGFHEVSVLAVSHSGTQRGQCRRINLLRAFLC